MTEGNVYTCPSCGEEMVCTPQVLELQAQVKHWRDAWAKAQAEADTRPVINSVQGQTFTVCSMAEAEVLKLLDSIPQANIDYWLRYEGHEQHDLAKAVNEVRKAKP